MDHYLAKGELLAALWDQRGLMHLSVALGLPLALVVLVP
jgi:hypothetical protein